MRSQIRQKVILLCIFIPLFLTICSPYREPSTLPASGPSNTPLPTPQAIELGILGKGSARDVVWSPDGSLLAVTSSTGVYLYDTQTWQVVKTIHKNIFGDKSFDAVTFSLDQKSLIMPVSDYTTSSFWRYDLQTDQAVPWLDALKINPQAIPVFSPDGKTFAFLNRVCKKTVNDGQDCVDNLELREAGTGKLLTSIPTSALGWESQGHFFIYSPNGKQLAAANQPNRITLWDTSTGKHLYEFLHDSAVASLSFSPDSRVLASASKDATVRFWDTQTGKNSFILRGFKQGLQYVTYHDNGKKLLIGQLYDNITQDYALDDHSLPTSPIGVAMQLGKNLGQQYSFSDVTITAVISLSPDTHQMAVLLNDVVQIWNVETGQPILTLPEYSSQIHALGFSADGNLLATGDHNIHLWQVPTQKFVATLPINIDEIDNVAFQPYGHQIAVIGTYQNVQIWDTSSRQKLREINAGDKLCNGASLAAFSPDGEKLAIAGSCGVSLWDAGTGQLLQKLVADKAGNSAGLAFNADGKDLIYITGRGIWRWDLTTGKLVYFIEISNKDNYWNAALSANQIVLGHESDGPFQFFDPRTGQHLYDFAEGRGGNAVALHPDGRLFARADYYKILLADSISGAKLLLIDFHLPYSILFSPDKKRLAASSYDNAVYLWDVSSAAKFAEATIPTTATPDPALNPTPTITPDPIPLLSIQPLASPTPGPGAIRPETISQLEKRGELGLGAASLATWAADGKTLAVGTSSGVYIFKSGSPHPIRFMPTGAGLNLLAFSPDTRLLAGQISNMAVQVWDVSTGRNLYKLDDTGCWNSEMAFSPDHQELSVDCGGTTYRWGMSDGHLLGKDKSRISSPNISSDGSLVAQFGMTSAHLLDTSSNDIVQTFDVPGMAPAWVKFSPDGKTLLVWFYKYEIARTGLYYPGKDPRSLVQLWDVIPGQQPTLRATFVPGNWLPEYIVTMGAFQGLAFSADSRQVFTASGDGQTQIWDVKSGKLQATLPNGRNIYLSPDGNQLLSVGNAVQIWDVSPGRAPALRLNIPGFDDPLPRLMFSADDKLVTASSDTFHIWSQSVGTFAEYPTDIKAPDAGITTFSVSPNGKWLAYSTSHNLVLGENDPRTPNWHTLETYANSTDYPLDTRLLVFSPDSAMLAVIDPDRKVLLWKLGQPATQPVEIASDVYFSDLFFSQDSRLLLGTNSLSSEESPLYLWDTGAGNLLRKWNAMGYQFVLHPNSTTLAAANYNVGTISLFDLNTWSILREMKGLPYIRDMAFSSDGSLLATLYDGKIELWDAATGALLRTLDGNFSRLAFSSDGRFLAASLWDGRIQIWGLPEK